jgi:hypothetical protein
LISLHQRPSQHRHRSEHTARLTMSSIPSFVILLLSQSLSYRTVHVSHKHSHFSNPVPHHPTAKDDCHPNNTHLASKLFTIPRPFSRPPPFTIPLFIFPPYNVHLPHHLLVRRDQPPLAARLQLPWLPHRTLSRPPGLRLRPHPRLAAPRRRLLSGVRPPGPDPAYGGG